MEEPPARPTGIATFLFTDIEGSTKMWERDADAMQKALVRHDEILRSAIEERGGYVFKTVGDAFCAAFSSAPDAVEAGLAGQRALSAEKWDETCAIRVRMALHSGDAEERGGDYFGPALNRVARLLSAGHGGQTLLSSAATTLAGDRLPHGSELRNMGVRRLKDLTRPERVFQLVTLDLPTSFPPLKTLDARRNNLPVQPTPLVGREREVGEVAGLLRRVEARLLTLVGPGGTGKTRLSLQAAAELLDEFEGGVFFVALAPISDPGLVASTIAGVLGVIETPEQPLAESLKTYLRSRETLLLLDNFEQVADAAPLVGELLGSCPKLKVLATSRVALRVYGEREYAVSPLALPDPTHLPSVARLSRYETVRLFVERARDAKAGFSLTEENARAVAEICTRLDGLPLAIELAAARVKILSPEAMLGRISNRLKLLKEGARDLPERQRTLRGAIDWSHDLLDDDERALFRRLSVFAGGRTLEAIEAICDPEGELDVLDGIGSMVDKSLIRQEEADGEPRFVMLETIHEYAREKLEESGEAEEIKRSHAAYFLALAEEAEPELVGPDQVAWMDRLEAEHDNLRAALSWSLDSGMAEAALRLAGALGWFWNVRGHYGEGRTWCEDALASDGGSASSLRAKALRGSGNLSSKQGDYERAMQRLDESLTVCRESADSKGEARSLCFLGESAVELHDFERASELLAESASISRRLGNTPDLAYTLGTLGVLAAYRGDLVGAKKIDEEALTLARTAGNIQTVATATANLGIVTMVGGDHEKARALIEEAAALMWALKDKGNHAIAIHCLGLIALLNRDLHRAAVLCAQSIETTVDLMDRLGVTCDLDVLAAVAGEQGDTLKAARLWGAAEALRDAVGVSQPSDEAAVLGPFVEATRSRIGETAWHKAWTAGRTMTQEQAIALALKNEEDTSLAETEPA